MRLRHGTKERSAKSIREDVGKIAGNTSGASVSIPPVGEKIFFVTEKKLSDRIACLVILSSAAWVLALADAKQEATKARDLWRPGRTTTPQCTRDAVEDKYPTASLAELQFDIDDWDDLTSGSARFTRFVRPRDLDPTLGPDAD